VGVPFDPRNHQMPGGFQSLFETSLRRETFQLYGSKNGPSGKFFTGRNITADSSHLKSLETSVMAPARHTRYSLT
jgi:hypothetical protein